MTVLRRFGIFIVGAILVIAGGSLWVADFPRPSFGWTAYAPLTSTTFGPVPSPNIIELAQAMIAVGLVLIAGWTGYRLGRRQP